LWRKCWLFRFFFSFVSVSRGKVAARPPIAVTNAVSWRSEGIKHRKNEIFLDVVEKLNLLVSSNGTVLNSEIIGAVKMKSFLSGENDSPAFSILLDGRDSSGTLLVCWVFVLSRLMRAFCARRHAWAQTGAQRQAHVWGHGSPQHQGKGVSSFAFKASLECPPKASSFNCVFFCVSWSYSLKAVELEDIKFHQCVRLARFENDRTISFIPPDGEFDLMNYRLRFERRPVMSTPLTPHLTAPPQPCWNSTHVKPLIWVEAVVEPHSNSRIEYMIKAKSQFKSRSIANNVEIIIPVPSDVDSPSFKSSIGTVVSPCFHSWSLPLSLHWVFYVVLKWFSTIDDDVNNKTTTN
jgi:AP-1 complex subunit mu